MSEWHDLPEDARQEIRRTVAAMMLVGVTRTDTPHYLAALKDIGRDWLKRHAPDALEPVFKEGPF